MILQDTIDKIYDAVRIEEVVADFVNLKKRGTSLIGLCPFHNEKTPSFNVSVTRGIYKCFGCGKGGDSVNFIMEHEKAAYPEALRYLAAKYQIKVEETIPDKNLIEKNDDRESLFILNRWAKDFFAASLLNSPEGTQAGLSYLRERGIRDSAIERFELGYSTESRYSLTQAALREGFQAQFLIASGLSIKPETGDMYDRFRGRVMFPIHNISGKIIGFGGRILRKEEKTAKYLNSPESAIYHKSESLYGISQAKKAIREKDICLLAEGYTDVISLSQSGIENVVASSGTSLTLQQIKLISRLTPNITILYDGDAAGIKASMRGIDLILEQGLHVRVLLFPEGHDPDSYIQKVGASAFTEYLEESQQDFILYKTQILLSEAGTDPIKRSYVIHDILESISKVPDSISREQYLKQCSELLGMSERDLLVELNKLIHQKNRAHTTSASLSQAQPTPPQQSPMSAQGPADIEMHLQSTEQLRDDELVAESELRPSDLPLSYPDDIQEKEILRLLVNYGDRPLEIGQTVSAFIFTQTEDIEFSNPLYEKFYGDLLTQGEKLGSTQTISFANIRDESIKKLFVDLLSSPYSLSANWDDMHQIKVKREEELLLIAADTAINHLKMRKLMRMITDNQEKMRGEKDSVHIMELQSIHGRLTQLKSDLSRALGVVVIK